MTQNTENQLSFEESLNRIETIEKHIVDLLCSIPANSELSLELNNAHCSLILSRQILQNSRSLAPSPLFASVGGDI